MNAPARASDFFAFNNSYARLPDRFYARLDPSPVREPKLIRINERLAGELALDAQQLASAEGVAILAGNAVPDGAEPLAMAYAGHQFGNFVPQLGDGRAILLGEVVGRDGVRRDIQLKGSGRTPFSRMGDGRAWLGPVLREYIVSEAMAALGIPTTRALAAVLTGEGVMRETPLPGAVLTRVSRSHVRVGTFQYFAARRDIEAIRLLADYVIERLYPDLAGADRPYLALLQEVVARQAALVAKWQGVGFIHGVMNTDNMSIAGETIDYGPCAFMDKYHPETVYSSIDSMGRYAFRNQPGIANWNLVCLAQAILPLIDGDEDIAVSLAQDAIDRFRSLNGTAWHGVISAKIGLQNREDDDQALADSLLQAMADGKADFTNAFRSLSALSIEPGTADATFLVQFDNQEAARTFLDAWRARLAREQADDATRQSAMRGVNPAYIPRNHRVEEAIEAALEGDFAPFETLVTVLDKPFDDQAERAEYAAPPRAEQVVQATFCGT